MTVTLSRIVQGLAMGVSLGSGLLSLAGYVVAEHAGKPSSAHMWITFFAFALLGVQWMLSRG